jgi:hypothetical protein
VSIYEGTEVEQSYAQGLALGARYADADRAGGFPGGTGALEVRAEADEARDGTRQWRAFKLGIARGYRMSVRTLRNGRWGS